MLMRPVMGASLILLGVMCLLTALAYSGLPEMIPIHWNARGEIDGYASRFWGAWLMPMIAAGILILFFVLPVCFPTDFQPTANKQVWDAAIMAMVVFFSSMQFMVLQAAKDPTLDVGRWIMIMVFSLFAFLGWWMPGLEPNRFMGVRTPWTLSDRRVWTDTHRFTAILFMGVGISGVILAVAGVHFLPLIFSLIAAATLPVLYSFIRFRQLHRGKPTR